MDNLKGKVALVTGGSRGIGRAITMALAGAGATVVLTYKSNRELAEQLAGAVEGDGGRARCLQLIVEDRNSVREVVAEVGKDYGAVDILVNNAAIAQEKPFDTITDDDWDAMLAVNLRGPFACTQEVLPLMRERGFGRIINITSIGGQWGGFNQVHYAASKAALINFTRSIAKIYSKFGITSNAVAPGLVATDMSAGELDTEAGAEKVRAIPAGRIGSVDEVSAAVVFLAGEAAGYITGQTINVNGGMLFG